MRRALATAALVGGVVLTPAVVAGPAHAAPVGTQSSVTAAASSGDTGDGSDHKGRWGLAGLLGMTGLFGYKKYKDAQGSRTGASVGGVDTDGTGSRRL